MSIGNIIRKAARAYTASKSRKKPVKSYRRTPRKSAESQVASGLMRLARKKLS
jgi:hypothetical protein